LAHVHVGLAFKKFEIQRLELRTHLVVMGGARGAELGDQLRAHQITEKLLVELFEEGLRWVGSLFALQMRETLLN
jgi:hypothetical protein